jgi:hypothetical protein
MEINFFQRANVQIALQAVIDSLRSRPIGDSKAQLLRDILGIIKANGAEFDEKCATNIGWIGSQLEGNAQVLAKTPSDDKALDLFIAFVYRFIVEFDLSNINDLSMELGSFLDFVRTNRFIFAEDAQRIMNYADHAMPIAIMKNLLGMDVLSNIRNVEKYAGDVEGKFSKWDKDLDDREERADQIKASLETYTTGFNFVGLYDGFNSLTTEKTDELKKLRDAQIFMGSLAIAPTLVELGVIVCNLANFDGIKYALLASAVPAISLTVLLVYFFRLSVRSVDSCKSQLLQLELRKTLCRFVQNYVEYVGKLKPEERESIAKFETVVFSGIVATDEKIPATFDGLEQLTKLLKVARSN